MLPETKLDRVIYLGAIPIVAAIIGGVAGTMLQAQSCDAIGPSEIYALLENAEMTGTQKLQFMESYKELTDRPWQVLRNAVSFISLICVMALVMYARGGGFERD